jgi:hypothetical protein
VSLVIEILKRSLTATCSFSLLQIDDDAAPLPRLQWV